jgi:hypothetical protein
VHINSAYPVGQLQAALAAAERAASRTAGPQGDASKAAAVRVRKWMDVINGMASRQINVGSRQPVKTLPVWVTPEVRTGGFTTGKAAAGGDMQPHELQLAHAAGIKSERIALAEYYLTDAGLSHIRNMLESGAYKVIPPIFLRLHFSIVCSPDAFRGVLMSVATHHECFEHVPVC